VDDLFNFTEYFCQRCEVAGVGEGADRHCWFCGVEVLNRDHYYGVSTILDSQLPSWGSHLLFLRG